MEELAFVRQVEIQIIHTPNLRQASVVLHIDVGLDHSEEIILSFPLLDISARIHRFVVSWVQNDCSNFFTKLFNLMELFEVSEPTQLEGKVFSLIIGNEGYAISDRYQEKWIVYRKDISTYFGDYVSKTQALHLVGEA